MTEVFISYSIAEKKLAELIYDKAEKIGFEVFMASVSQKPGDLCTDTILDNLNEADIVIFLASKKACKSSYVQQEIGAAINDDKWLIPILIDITPEELPGWSKDYYAIDYRTAGLEDLETELKNEYRYLQRISFAKAFGLGVLIGLAYRTWNQE